ncbi:hypothetical protein EDB92DRAFT_1862758 [Lactarius akahatsu]|uniref:Secreted protein n=1 Tax=Lactarius akahatsu TaxID=416441 RepID=A0AAD4LKZ3_9AGAM|nr:hypothetical protein EDB92DRAFT_1862758 [Lactarius akahatsu]
MHTFVHVLHLEPCLVFMALLAPLRGRLPPSPQQQTVAQWRTDPITLVRGPDQDIFAWTYYSESHSWHFRRDCKHGTFSRLACRPMTSP